MGIEELGDAVRFLQSSAIAIAISDAMRPDVPLVYVNPAFETLTGYAQDRVAGRNCRFLQAGLDNDAARAELRDAIGAGRPAQVVLRNRTAAGFEFDNLLFLEPLRNGAGDIRFFAGSQFDVSTHARRDRVGDHADRLQRDLERLQTVNRDLVFENRGQLARSAAQVIQQWMHRRESRA